MPPKIPPLQAATKIIAEGYIKSISASRFKGLVRNSQGSYLVAGIFGNSVPDFCSVRTVFSAVRADGFIGTKPLEGRIGPDRIKLKTSDGSTLTGPLDMPIEAGTTVCGAITFTPI